MLLALLSLLTPLALADPCTARLERLLLGQEAWVPGNQPSARHRGFPDVVAVKPELPGFVAPGSLFTRQGIAFGPGEKFEAAFNPAAFVARDAGDGVEKVFLVIRGERELPNAKWKRRSLPYLASSEDGVHFKLVQEEPLFEPTDWFDKTGGVEDPRYADLRAQPYVDPADGKSFDGALLYTGFDGKTARVAAVYFNHGNLKEFRKGGTLFPDADVSRNPLFPDPAQHAPAAWNKSPAVLQYADPATGRVRNILYVGEGNSRQGGIMALEADRPFSWKWPKDRAPAIRARPGHYDQNLVEPAFQPVIAPLPAWLAKKTGQKNGIYLCLHGDSPPRGYQVGFRIFSLDDPTGAPIYESDGPFLWPQEKYELEGQVGKVVFASGSVEFKGRRFIYYGAADKFIGVASAPAFAPLRAQ